MSLQYDALHAGIIDALESLGRMSEAQQRLDEAIAADIARLWQDNAALRDELHAVANRVEALTRGRT